MLTRSFLNPLKGDNSFNDPSSKQFSFECDDTFRVLERLSFQRRELSNVELAETFLKRSSRRKINILFQIWKRHSFRYVYLREQLFKSYQLDYLSKKFLIWKISSKKSVLLRRYIKRRWQRLRKLSFRRWKWETLWLMRKDASCRPFIRSLTFINNTAKLIASKYAYLIQRIREKKAAIIIQRALTRYMLRKYFAAAKTIKYYFMLRFAAKLTVMRRRKEKLRITSEIETIKVLVKKGFEVLDLFLSEPAGVEMFNNYLAAVNGKIDGLDTVRHDYPMFPSIKEVPELAKCWTTSAKAMVILRQRCLREIKYFCRYAYRLISPPIYECKKCRHAFYLADKLREHVQKCRYEEKILKCNAWLLAEPISEMSLLPIKKHFAKLSNKKQKKQKKPPVENAPREKTKPGNLEPLPEAAET